MYANNVAMPTFVRCTEKHVSGKINQYLLPTGLTAANLLLLWAWAETEMDGQTDGHRTVSDPAPRTMTALPKIKH